MYRDDRTALEARLRSVEAELEAERRKREAAEADARAAAAREDELRVRSGFGIPPAVAARRRRLALAAVLLGPVLLFGVGWSLSAARSQRASHALLEWELRDAQAKLNRSEAELSLRRAEERRKAREERLGRVLSLAGDVELRLNSAEPPSVRVLDDRGRVLGLTPLVLRVRRSAAPLRLSFLQEGYHARELEVLPDTSRRVTVQLERVK
ncbi:MAG: hypothetical protein IT371_00230 [Deltaproteobacteria bacterium]|nr:hypothetical protein [Deltaproteobacteria bacterium]